MPRVNVQHYPGLHLHSNPGAEGNQIQMATRTRGRPSLGNDTVISDETLLDAVLKALGENGFDGTSVREIARGLDVSHNLIPQRFGSKKRLWYTAIDHGFGRLQAELMRKADSLGDDKLLVLRGIVTFFVETNARHPSLLQIINHEASRPGPRLDYLFDTYIEPVRDFGERWLADLADEGLIAPVSVTLLYFLMTHGAGGVFAMPALTSRLAGSRGPSDPEVDIRAQAENAANILFDGLLTR